MTRRIIGQAPGRTLPYGPPLGGRAGAFLARLAGLGSYDVLRERTVVENVLTLWPGKSPGGGKGDAFPLDAARIAVEKAAAVKAQAVREAAEKAAAGEQFAPAPVEKKKPADKPAV